jgi:capsule polysaccharide export protein KpsE/RkpR
MVLTLATAVVAWLAVGDSVDGAAADHRAAAAALTQGTAIAEAADSLADQLQNSVNGLVVGTGSAGEAMTHVIEISQNVEKLRVIVESLDSKAAADTLVEIQTGLGEAQASLLETQGGLDEAQQSLIDTQPAIQSAITALEAIPDQLRAAQADLTDSDGDFDNQLGLWRTAIALGAVTVLLGLFVIDRLTRSR